MNRTQQLKLLNEEIRRLFSEDVDENDAFDQLSTDQRFESVQRTSVQSLYKKLQKEHEKKQLDDERKKSQLNEERKKKQLEDQHKQMIYYRQKAENLLLYEGLSVNKTQYVMNVWQNRYFVIAKDIPQDDGVNELNVHDVFQNISKEISFLMTYELRGIHFLSNNLIILDEWDISAVFLRLARIDLAVSSLDFIQRIDSYDYSYLLLDSSNPSKFLLICEHQNTVIICNLVDDRIEVEPKVELDVDLSGDANTYLNDQLLVFDVNEWTQHLSNAKIRIQDLDAEKKSKTLKLEPLPNNVCFYHRLSDFLERKWSGDHLFISIQFSLTSEFGIAFTNPQTCKWSILEFAINLSIGKLLVANNRDLLVCSQKFCLETDEYLLKDIYKLPMRKPELLRYKAWTKTVNLFKKKQVTDPYEEARQYLPFNSDIRGSFAAEQDDDE